MCQIMLCVYQDALSTLAGTLNSVWLMSRSNSLGTNLVATSGVETKVSESCFNCLLKAGFKSC